MKSLIILIILFCFLGCNVHDRKYPIFDSAWLNKGLGDSIQLGDGHLSKTIVSGSDTFNFNIDSIQPPAQFALGGSYSGSQASFFVTAYGKLAAYQTGDSPIIVIDSGAAIRAMMQCMKYYFKHIKPQQPLCLCGKLHFKTTTK